MATTRTPKSIRMFMTSFFLPHFIKIVNIKKIDWQHFDRMLPGFLSFFFITDKTGEISRDYANSWHFTSMVENWSFFFSCFIFYLFIFFFSFLNYYYPFFLEATLVICQIPGVALIQREFTEIIESWNLCQYSWIWFTRMYRIPLHRSGNKSFNEKRKEFWNLIYYLKLE